MFLNEILCILHQGFIVGLYRDYVEVSEKLFSFKGTLTMLTSIHVRICDQIFSFLDNVESVSLNNVAERAFIVLKNEDVRNVLIRFLIENG